MRPGRVRGEASIFAFFIGYIYISFANGFRLFIDEVLI